MTPMPAWLSKVAAISLLVALLALVAFYGAYPLWRGHQSVDEEIAQSEQLIERFAKARDQKAAYEARIAELRDRQAQSGTFIAGETDAMAAADLQQRIKAAVDNSGGQLKSTQILALKDDEAFERVAVRIAMVGTIESFFQLLHDLEGGRPYTFIDNLDVKARRARRRKADQEDVATQLTIRFDLYGYLSPEAGS